MLSKEKLTRLNELANKAKGETLTAEELEEQVTLREEYLRNFRKSMRKTIENVRIYDEAGEDVTPKKVKNIRTNKKHH